MSTARKCKTKYFAKSALLYSAVSAGLILSVKFIFAQENTRSITIVPPAQEIVVDPGSRQEGSLKVVNNSEGNLSFTAQVKDFVVNDSVGTPFILPDDTLSKKYSASAWIGVEPTSFDLAAGKTQKLSYYLQVPVNARPGGHYAAIVYQPQQVIGVQGTGTGVETHIGTLLYVRVKGDIVENATVKKFEAANKFLEYGPATINTQIINYGDSHIRPLGIITIKNVFGQTVEQKGLEEHNIFPEASRDFVTTIGAKYLFGPYTVELHANYGDKADKTLFATTSFFVMPWKIAGLVVLGVIVVILLIIFWKKKKKQSQPIPQATQ